MDSSVFLQHSWESCTRPAVVVDCGTGYTKLGFSGNQEPSFVLPTVVADWDPIKGKEGPLDDLNYSIGDEGLAKAASSSLTYPVKHGMVTDWDHMEKFWHQAIAHYLRIDSQDHNFILTEPPLNTPENREVTAEIMFETFGVPGLYIGVQAILALYASFAAAERTGTGKQKLTGLVLDIGDGVTHIIPVADGFVIGTNIKSVPLAGRDVTHFIQQLIRDRGEPVPPELSLNVARTIKERFCYLASDIIKEFVKHDAQPEKYNKHYTGINPKTGASFTCDVGYERFLGPEIFFQPELFSTDLSIPLPQMMDEVVQKCPIDTRRALYGNVVLSGGSTMFRDFGRRIQRDMARRLTERLPNAASCPQVNVLSHQMQRFAVWFGGSVLGTVPDFPKICHSKADYEEHGPSICRTNAVFRDG